ncbi:hypothetical protein CCC_01732 [Paramagnetospirillum magnetotacticum MS-1]|uniref:Uncharacterized protein n=1 Tax=Paramagnetospirillum magnetotacticum MS-1 TaxID=272627 RepID=A0A0C2UGP7_PARME|nr:hypothetical protein [Paramagnetospirillum magnetotacticum]KIM00738.1 hypothetical protein CCC_01732 [Paramagnetospirillum magnetotacticum MS-1]
MPGDAAEMIEENFADVLDGIAISNGIVRMSLAKADPDVQGKTIPVCRVVMPVRGFLDAYETLLEHAKGLAEAPVVVTAAPVAPRSPNFG